MAVVLVVEDNISIRLLIRARLSQKYEVLEAEDGNSALAVMDSSRVDLLIVDIMMEGMDGFELVRTLRDSGIEVPVIMLTALTGMSYKKKGFDLGIDDYMTKPVDCDELTWRIEAILRRAKINSSNEINTGSLTLSRKKMNAVWNCGETQLTEKEFELLFKLLSYPETVFTKHQIMDDVWGFESEADFNTIKTYINRLRNKFATCRDFEIVSVHGLGYKAVLKGSVEKR